MYNDKDNGKVIHGILNDSAYTALKEFCQLQSSSKINDTIIIKYDFNHEHCWSNLDMGDKDHINRVIDNYNASITNSVNSRPSISVFQFREPGNGINKYKKWNTSIGIDSSRLLSNLLFTDQVVCGSSAIILPDKRFILIRSDAHFEALRYTSEMTTAILNINND